MGDIQEKGRDSETAGEFWRSYQSTLRSLVQSTLVDTVFVTGKVIVTIEVGRKCGINN